MCSRSLQSTLVMKWAHNEVLKNCYLIYVKEPSSAHSSHLAMVQVCNDCIKISVRIKGEHVALLLRNLVVMPSTLDEAETVCLSIKHDAPTESMIIGSMGR